MLKRAKLAFFRLLIAISGDGRLEIFGKPLVEHLISNWTYVKEEHQRAVVVHSSHSVHDMGWPNDPVVEESRDTNTVYETIKTIEAPLSDLVDNVREHRRKSLKEIDAWIADLLRLAEREKRIVIAQRDHKDVHTWEQLH